MSSSDSNVSLFSSAFGVVCSISFSFSADNDSTLASASLVSSFSETSAAGASTTTVSDFSSAAGASACGLSTAFVSFESADSVSLLPPLTSALASVEVEDDASLAPSPTCALTTVGEKKMQYPNTQDTNPTDSFLVPYLGFLLADFSFFFSINSLKFSNFTSTNIHHIFIRM